MSDDAKLENIAEEEVVETVEEEQLQESEELVENENDENEEVLDEGSLEEAAKKEAKHEDEEEEHEEEEVKKEAAEPVQIPKTKAGVIQAAVDMLKKARKEDAQKMFAKLVKIDGEEESIKSADKAKDAGDKKIGRAHV